jgi:transposase
VYPVVVVGYILACSPVLPDHFRLLIGLVAHSAEIQDRDGAPDVLKTIVSRYPSLRHVFADGGYAGPELRDALKTLGRWSVQIIKRSDTAEGFEVLPRRWVVERTFAWLNRCRRLSKDREKSIASAEAWILIAHIRRVTRVSRKRLSPKTSCRVQVRKRIVHHRQDVGLS